MRVVRPFFLKHEAAFDNVVSDLSGKAKSAAESVAKEGKQYLCPQKSIFSLLLN